MKKVLWVLILAAVAAFSFGCNEKTDERQLLAAANQTAAKPSIPTGEPLYAPGQIHVGGTVTVDSVVLYRSGDRRANVYGHCWASWPLCESDYVYGQVDFGYGNLRMGFYTWQGEASSDPGTASLWWLSATLDLSDGSSGGAVGCGNDWGFYWWDGGSCGSTASATLSVVATANPLGGCNKFVSANSTNSSTPVYYR